MNTEEKQEEQTSIFEQFTTFLSGNDTKSLIIKYVCLGVIVLLFLLFFISGTQKKARAEQIEAVMPSAFTQKKVAIIPYGDLKTTIGKNEELTVLFLTPNTTSFTTIQKVFQEKENIENLTAKVYVYPLFYPKNDELSPYKIQEETVLVYFEKGKETNRSSLSDRKDLETKLIKEINDVSMYSIKSFSN